MSTVMEECIGTTFVATPMLAKVGMTVVRTSALFAGPRVAKMVGSSLLKGLRHGGAVSRAERFAHYCPSSSYWADTVPALFLHRGLRVHVWQPLSHWQGVSRTCKLLSTAVHARTWFRRRLPKGTLLLLLHTWDDGHERSGTRARDVGGRSTTGCDCWVPHPEKMPNI